MSDEEESFEELVWLGVDHVELVTAYQGRLRIVCLGADGVWELIAVWEGAEQVAFHPPPGLS